MKEMEEPKDVEAVQLLEIQQGKEAAPSLISERWKVAAAIGSFAFCSSLLLVVNKVTVHYLPSPGLVLFGQLLSAAFVVLLLDDWHLIKADELEWSKVRAFIPVAATFALTIFTSVKALEYANVETFIVVRSSTPIPVAILDYLYLGRELPSLQSFASMLIIVAGCIGYVLTDAFFKLKAYAWVVAWLAVFVFDQVYIKHVVETVEMTTWGRVFYSNLLSLVPIAVLGFLFDQAKTALHITAAGFFMLLFSSLLGVGMSFSSFFLRKLVSATTFTMVGTLCKIFTVIINILIWDKHATGVGLMFLSLCMGAGFFYKQAPPRKK